MKEEKLPKAAVELIEAWKSMYNMQKRERDEYRAKYLEQLYRAESLQNRCNELLKNTQYNN